MNSKTVQRLVLSALVLLAASPAFSQFSIGGNIGIPSGNWSNAWGVGIGIDGRYEAPIQDKLNWTASLGYNSFAGRTYLGYSYNSVSVVPVIGGVKYYVQKSNEGFYVAADAGLYFWSSGYAGGSTTRFGLAPGIGYRIPKFDFSFRYNAMSDVSYAGLRAAYVFPK